MEGKTMLGKCEVCGLYGTVIKTIYAATGRTVHRCPEHLNTKEDYSKKMEAT
jgi:hypothetical protein